MGEMGKSAIWIPSIRSLLKYRDSLLYPLADWVGIPAARDRVGSPGFSTRSFFEFFVQGVNEALIIFRRSDCDAYKAAPGEAFVGIAVSDQDPMIREHSHS
jgi:hypothetical protein